MKSQGSLGNRDSKERLEGAGGQHHRDLREEKEGERGDGRGNRREMQADAWFQVAYKRVENL